MKRMRTRLLASILLSVLAGCAQQARTPTALPEDPYRLDPDVAPVRQQLRLVLDPAQPEYDGTTRITVELAGPRQRIRLHALDMTINSVHLSNDAGRVDVEHRIDENGFLAISADRTLQPGIYKLEIAFSNDFNVNGESIYRTEREGKWYVFSQFEAIQAREAFPCFDEPGFKFPWQVTISAPTDQVTISNAPVLSETVESGMRTTAFAATPPLPSYLIAVAVGDFETVDIPGLSIPGRIVAPTGKIALAAHAAETTAPLLDYLEAYFGMPYPFAKLDQIATYQAFSGAMEHPGAITYSDHILLLDDNATDKQRRDQIRVNAHELAHQWFGNLVTMEWWDDLWLNESFADWMGDKTVEHVFPQYGRSLDELRTTFRVMDYDARPTSEPIRHEFKANDNFFDGVFLAYYKGKAVLAMFERVVGEEDFRRGINRYLERYSWKNAEAADLWSAINVDTDFDLAASLATFIDQPGIPLVTISEVGEGRYRLQQSRLVNPGSDIDASQQWTIPVDIKYGAAGEIRSASLLLDEISEVIDLGDGVEWIEPNREQWGYYRWNLSDELLMRLETDALEQLSVTERMGLLSNSWALLVADESDGDDLLATLDRLSRDTDPAVISTLIDRLGEVETTFITPALEDEFAAYVRALLVPVLARIGQAPGDPGEPPDITRLRSQILALLANQGQDENARRLLVERADAYLADDLPADALTANALVTAAMNGGPDLLERMLSKLDTVDAPAERLQLLRAIGTFRDPVASSSVRTWLLEAPLTPNDIANVGLGMVSSDDDLAGTRAWLMEVDPWLRGKLPPSSMSRMPRMVADDCDPTTLAGIINFYGAPERQVPGIDDALAQLESRVRNCAGFRAREIESVRAYLEQRSD